MRTSVLFVASLISLTALPRVAAALELKNDGFTDGANVAFQNGFAAGEIGASRFIPPSPGVQLLSVQFLFGGDGGVSGMKDVTLHVWDDSGMQDDPGTELFGGEFTVTSSDEAMQLLDVSQESITVPGAFRVGVEFHQSGLPSIARDDDGTVAPDRNFILACSQAPPDPCGTQFWINSTTVPGLNGDWIIRAEVSGNGSGSGGGSGTGTGTGTGTGSGGAGNGTPGGECQGSDDCPIGQYCSDQGWCTYDCREDIDCPAGNKCNSLGACVAASAGEASDDGGCSTAPGGGVGVASLLGAVAALAAALRRRRG